MISSEERFGLDQPDAYEVAIEAMANAIVNKVLHTPTSVLKQAQIDGSGEDYVDAVRTLFDLPAPEHEDNEIKPLDDNDQE